MMKQCTGDDWRHIRKQKKKQKKIPFSLDAKDLVGNVKFTSIKK